MKSVDDVRRGNDVISRATKLLLFDSSNRTMVVICVHKSGRIGKKQNRMRSQNGERELGR
jgi:hypothetical protein